MMNQLTISLDAGMSLEESDLGSETSSGYCDSVPPYLEPQYQIDGAAVAQQSAFFASPMGTMSPTFYPASPSFCEQAIYCDPGYEDPLQGVQYEESSLVPVVPLPTGVPQNRLTSPPLTIMDPPLRSAQAAHPLRAEPSVAPSRNSTEKPPLSVEGHLVCDDGGGGLITPPESQPEAAVAAAGPPPSSTHLDPPVLTPLPGSKSWAAPTNWAEAKEFVPKVKVEKPRSWAQVVNTGVTYPGCEVTPFQMSKKIIDCLQRKFFKSLCDSFQLSIAEAESLLCPFYRVGECRYPQTGGTADFQIFKYIIILIFPPRYGVGCAYIHGQQCDYCGQAVNHSVFLSSLIILSILLSYTVIFIILTFVTHQNCRCCTRPTWISGAATWLSACRSTRGTWSSASRWQGVRRRLAASAWRLSSTSPRGRQGTAERFACPYPTWILLCSGLGSFPTAPTASACRASASGGRPSSSSTRSFAPAQSAGRPRTTSAPADFGWRLQRRREDC